MAGVHFFTRINEPIKYTLHSPAGKATFINNNFHTALKIYLCSKLIRTNCWKYFEINTASMGFLFCLYGSNLFNSGQLHPRYSSCIITLQYLTFLKFEFPSKLHSTTDSHRQWWHNHDYDYCWPLLAWIKLYGTRINV